MERSFRIPEISDELGMEGKLGIAGAFIGLIGGVAIDTYCLGHPSANFDDRIANLRTNIDNLDSLRSDLYILPPRKQAVVKNFIKQDTLMKQTEIKALNGGHPQPSSPTYEKVVVAGGSTVIFGMAAVAATCLIQDYRQKRAARREAKLQMEAQEYETETRIQEQADRGIDMLSAYLRRQGKEE
jgi:hypothetical protein